jgi:dienelactone hydrolase
MKNILILVSVFLFSLPADAKVVSQAVEYRHGATELKGYLAFDDTQSGKRPGVLVVHEWWGLNDYVKARVEKLAELGYIAFALDLYGKDVWTSDPQKAKELSSHLRGTPLLRQRAAAGLEILKANPMIDPARIAAIGYCFGGTTVLELAYSGADVAGVVSFHGGLTVPRAEDAGKLKAAILICHGADDGFVSAESIDAFQKAMRDAGVDWQMIYYGGAVHSFTNPGADTTGMAGVGYSLKADERSWAHMQTFLKEILK